MKNRTIYSFVIIGLLTSSHLKAQQKDYYYENQTRYGTFRNYVNGGSKLISGRDYAGEMATSYQEAKRMTAEREKQRKIELDRMRNTSGTKQTSENQQSENDVRFETLKFPSGNTYTGKTLNGEPHGEGAVTFASDGRVMKGQFRYGQADGMMTITDKLYVQTGKFVNGKPVGDQRYEFDDGNTKLVEIKNMETGASTVQYPDRTSFSGISDENGKYLKGKVLYRSGITFDGDYKNGRPFRGVWEKEGRIMIGEFAEATQTEIYLRFGYHYDPVSSNVTYGSFSPGMKRIGYSRIERPNNSVQHEIYGENETIIYVYVQFASGNILSVKAKQDGYDYVGTLYDAATNNLDPVIWDKKSGIKTIPVNDPLADKAKAYSKEVAPAINAGKHEFEAKWKVVEPYITAYNNNTTSKAKSENTYNGNNEKSTIKYSDGSTFEGEVNADNQAHGKGKRTYSDGVYIGDFLNDNKHGKGKWTGNDGGTFEGDFASNSATGKGKYNWPNGDSYEGEVANWWRTGKGKYTWKNGDVYEGDFLNNLHHGKGKKTYADGKVEDGIWENGIFKGK